MTTALLIDAGFLRKKFEEKGIPYETSYVEQVIKEIIKEIQKKEPNDTISVFFFDAPAFRGSLTKPISRQKFLWSEPENQVLLDMEQGKCAYLNVSVRKGNRSFSKWELKPNFVKDYLKQAAETGMKDNYYCPKISQKEVDGLIHGEIFKLSLRENVDRIVLVTNDTDFVSTLAMVREEQRSKSPLTKFAVVAFNYQDISPRLYGVIDGSYDVTISLKFLQKSMEEDEQNQIPTVPQVPTQVVTQGRGTYRTQYYYPSSKNNNQGRQRD